MLGSGGAPALPAYAQSLLPQVAQPIANQVGVNVQPQADNDPPSHQVVDRDTDKDSSGLVQKTASKMLDVTDGSDCVYMPGASFGQNQAHHQVGG